MNRKATALVSMFVTLLLAVSLAPALAQQPQGQALVQVVWHSDGDLAKVEAAGIEIYARLESADDTYFLAGATPKQVELLRAGGLGVKVLDVLDGGTYYLAQVMPGRPAPDWSAYGRALLDDGRQVLLRTAPQDAERLPPAGVEITAVTLTPKPVRPAAPERTFPSAVDWDPVVQAMIDDVQSSQVSQYDRELAGEVPVWVDGAWYTITSRYTYSGTPIRKATRYVGQHMAGLGLAVEYHQWGGANYPNVIGQKTGLVDPGEVYIIGGHLDDVSGTPGADDNASGSVAALIAADILSQYQWNCTLRFAFWTGEEQGLNGSYAYAYRAYQNGENIVGYLNLDMVAWNTLNSSRDIDLYYSTSIPPSLTLAQLLADVVDTYDLGLNPQLGAGVGNSDHYSFWQYGYPAILGIEDMSDFNPYYHGPGDTPAHTDLAYFTDYVKASLATLVHMSGCLQEPPTVHVSGLGLRGRPLGGGFAAMGLVGIRDQVGQVMPGAVVSVRWTLPDGTNQDQQSTTDATGFAKYRVYGVQPGAYKLCVTGVVKDGYIYDPDQNLMTCDTVTIP